MSSHSDSVEIDFLSYWSYQPKSSRQPWSDAAATAYRLMTAIKNAGHYRGTPAIDGSIRHLIANFSYGDFFGDDCIAVPIPGHAPRAKNALWVPLEICNALREHGLVGDVDTCLSRSARIQRSSTAGRGNRSDPIDHYNSIDFATLLNFGESRVILVDDIITRGATVLGCAAKIRDSVAGVVEIRGFALERTMGLNNFSQIHDPVFGTVSGTQYYADREP